MTSFMNQRLYQRVATEMQSRVSCFGTREVVTVVNISKNGMCIISRRGYSLNSALRLTISVPGKEMILSARVSRPVQDMESGKMVGVEILDAPEEYFYFVDYLSYLQFVL